MDFFDWIFETIVDVLGDMFSDRTGRRRRPRRIGSAWTTVPELRDLSVAEARDALARADLRMKLMQQTAGADPATAKVLDQDPPPWRTTLRRRRVTVRI